jgi:plasmid stabilization system protein ParE
MARYRLQYHPHVADDLFKIFLLIEDYAGSDVAHRKLSEIELVMRNLCDFPYVGTARAAFNDNLRAIPAAEKGVICFTVSEEPQTIFVLCVSYAGSDWMARIRERQ